MTSSMRSSIVATIRSPCELVQPTEELIDVTVDRNCAVAIAARAAVARPPPRGPRVGPAGVGGGN